MLNQCFARRAISTAVLLISSVLRAQTGSTSQPEQAPKTAPQVKQVLPSYEGQNVTTVELAGQPELNPQALLPLLSQRAGEPFSQSKVDASVAALQQRGGFQAVELEIRPDPEGVRVLFVLQPAIYYGIYEFPGAINRFPYSRLLQVAQYPPRGAYSSVDVAQAQRALETFFQRSGYFLAEVRPEVQIDKVHGLANVIFHTTLNRRARFGQVEISGTTPDETAHLQKVLRSWRARIRGSAIRQGKSYSLRTLENATQYLENDLMKRDHLAGQVKLIGANYDPQTNHADIHFNVTLGPLVHVKVEGAHLWSWTRRRLLPLYQQVGLDPELIQEGRQNLISHFQSKGFFDVKVDTHVQQQPNGQTVLYQITKGPRHKVKAVDIAGNQHISDEELRSVLKVGKARFFSRGQFSDKLVRTSVNNLKRVYQADGFSSVQVTPEVENRNGNIAVTFRVDEGPQDIVETLRLEGNTVPETQLAPQGLRLAAGQPYSTKRVDEDRNQIMAQYLRFGFLNATFRQTARQIANDKHRLEVVYTINEGPRVETATVVTVGRKSTRQSLIDRTHQLKAGGPIREDELLASESRLYSLGVFDWAQVDPRRQITTQTQEDVLVKVHEAKKNSLTYGVGFEVINRGGSVPSGTVALPNLPIVGLPSNFKTSQETFWGPRGTLEYTRKNFRGKAQTLTIGGLAARLVQRANFTFTDPYFRGSDWASTLNVSGEHNSENPIFTSRLFDTSFQIQRPLNEDKTRTLFFRYSIKQTGITHLLIPDLVPPQDQHVRLSTLSASYIRDTRDNVLDAHRGIYESLQLDFNPQVLGSSVGFAKLLSQVAYYKKIVGDVVFANSVRLGLELPFADSHVPLSELFFTGGGSTLRGFPLNGAGPQRTVPACGNPADPSTCAKITVPVGGRELFIVNSEFRVPIKADLPWVHQNLGVVAFYDGGNVYDRIGFHNFFADFSNTVGLGLRYRTPVGPIRIDVGHNLNPQPGIKSTQFFITLGQAF